MPAVACCVAQTIARLRGEWDIVSFANIVESSPSLPVLTAALTELQYVHTTTALECCHQTVIAGAIDCYIAGRPNKRTNVTIQKNLRRFEKMGAVAFTRVENAGNVESYLDRFFTALRERDQEMGRPGLEGDYLRYRRFFSALCHAEPLRRFMHFFVLTLDNEPVDYEFAFMDDHIYYSYRGVFESAYARYGAGNVRRLKLYEYVRASGVPIIDYLRGSEEYKLYWTDRQQAILALEARPRYGWGLLASLWRTFVTTHLRRIGVLLILHRKLRRLADKRPPR